jgi:hypothetical protein
MSVKKKNKLSWITQGPWARFINPSNLASNFNLDIKILNAKNTLQTFNKMHRVCQVKFENIYKNFLSPTFPKIYYLNFLPYIFSISGL